MLFFNLYIYISTCTALVLVRISHLNVEHIIRRMSFDEVVSGPSKRFFSRIQLVHYIHLITILKNGPRQDSSSESHRETKLDMISSVIQSFGKIKIRFASIFQTWISSPRYLIIHQFTSCINQTRTSLVSQKGNTITRKIVNGLPDTLTPPFRKDPCFREKKILFEKYTFLFFRALFDGKL